MIPRHTPLTFGIADLAMLVTACATLQSTSAAQSSPDAAAVALVTEFYDFKAELTRQMQGIRRYMDALDVLEEQAVTLKEHPLFYALMKKAGQLAAQNAADPARAASRLAEVEQTMSEEEGKLAEKLSELSQQEKMLSAQRTKLNDRNTQLGERFHTFRRRTIALMTNGAHVSLSATTDVDMAFQEVRAAFDRLNTLVRTLNEQAQRRKAP